MSTIHGGSTKALRAMRDKPAALSVYWDYCARRNHEGVAFPSLRGLASDTGWAINTCDEARTWLVACGALVEVQGYIRPQWRNLVDGDQRRRLALDKARYYRVTGWIVISGKRIPLLYAPAQDADDTPDDVSAGATSQRADHRPGETELDLISEPDSSKTSQLDSTVVQVPDSPGAAAPPDACTGVQTLDTAPTIDVDAELQKATPEEITAIVELVNQNIQLVTPHVADVLMTMIDVYGAAHLRAAIHEAVMNEHRKLSYLETVARRLSGSALPPVFDPMWKPQGVKG